MTSFLCFYGGLILGALTGVVLMAILQINRINVKEGHRWDD